MSPKSCSIVSLPNLGPQSARMLERAGIDSVVKLRRLGSVGAFLRVRATDPRASLNLLWGLEAALSDPPRRWQDVAREDRLRLLLAVEDAKSIK